MMISANSLRRNGSLLIRKKYKTFLGSNRTIYVPNDAILVFYNENNLDMITEKFISDTRFKAEFRYLYIQKTEMSQK